MLDAGKELLQNVLRELFELGDLRHVPPVATVATVKVFTLHVIEEANFFLENLGFIAFRDKSRG